MCSKKDSVCFDALSDLQLYMYVTCLCLLLHVCSVELLQTIPENRPACPGEELQYTCTSPQHPIWKIAGIGQFPFGQDDDVNSNGTLDGFFLLLTVQNANISVSTATNDMITSSYDGRQVTCFGGDDASSDIIDVAGTVICNR